MSTIKIIILFYFALSILVGYSPLTISSELEYDSKNLSLINIKEIQRRELFKNKIKDYKNILLAKRGLINGELYITNDYLSKIDDGDTTLLPIKIRYQAISYFIKGRYNKVLELLSNPIFNQVRYYKNICLLKIISLLTLPVSNDLKREVSKCRNLNRKNTINDSMWLSNMELLKLNETSLISGMKPADIKNIISDQELIRIWLKTGLYLGENKLISKNMSVLPASTYTSKRFRELMGFYWYRLGDYDKAKSFIEDINTANTDNIRGNINLKEKKYELAFGHFKLALQKKSNSINSLERAIPLAWNLEQWKDGNALIASLVGYGLDKNKLKTLEAAFQIRQGNFILAKRNLNLLDVEYKGQAPLIITQMQSYVAFMLNDIPILKLMSDRACKKFDGLNCWIQGQLLIWENISKTSLRDEFIKGDNKFFIDDLKIKVVTTQIKEEVLIDQYDIEELDSKMISVENFMIRKIQ
jgi:tetratricopeptide (TPR) repeat protein